jgi:hypothetical protein
LKPFGRRPRGSSAMLRRWFNLGLAVAKDQA